MCIRDSYVPWLEDRKWAHIRVEGEAFGGVPLNMEIKLEVVDSPNSAGITIDAVRMVKHAMDRGIGGALEWSSAYLMKSPPWQHDDDIAKEQLEAFLAGGAPGRDATVRNAEGRRADGGRAFEVKALPVLPVTPPVTPHMHAGDDLVPA